MSNQVDEQKLLDDRNENDNENASEDEDEQDQSDEDFDTGIKDDILRPASTRSKIVVNLREPQGSNKRK